MSRTISYTVSDEDFNRIHNVAMNKGLTPSQFTKTSVFSYLSKYAVKSPKPDNGSKYQK